jgi:hypothetical protein
MYNLYNKSTHIYFVVWRVKTRAWRCTTTMIIALYLKQKKKPPWSFEISLTSILRFFYFHLNFFFIIKYLIEAQFCILTNIKYNKKKTNVWERSHLSCCAWDVIWWLNTNFSEDIESITTLSSKGINVCSGLGDDNFFFFSLFFTRNSHWLFKILDLSSHLLLFQLWSSLFWFLIFALDPFIKFQFHPWIHNCDYYFFKFDIYFFIFFIFILLWI